VHGNVDEAELRRALPGELEPDLSGRRICVVHDAGPRRRRAARLERWFPGAAAVIFGHSHVPLHELTDGGMHLFQPR
jgi:predicted phosphodiesterase